MTSRQIGISGALFLGVLVVSVFIAMGIVKSKKEKETQAPPKIIRKVKTEMVDYTQVESQVSGRGRIVSQQQVEVISEVQGKILQGDIPLKKGSNFREGQILFRLYSKDSQLSLLAHKSAYLNLLANILPDLKIDYSDDYNTWREYFESINIEKALPQLPDINSEQLKIFLASRNVLSEYYAIRSEEERLKKYIVRAPFGGSVTEVYLETGSVANPGSRVASIIKTNRLEIEVPLETDEVQWVNVNDKVSIRSEDQGKEYTGRVLRKADFIDPSTQSVNVYVSIDQNKVQNLYSGQYMQVNFKGMFIDEAMEIPRSAVFNSNEVFTVDSGYLDKQLIDIVKINDKSIVFRGLPKGTELVVEPLANANENTPVQTSFNNVHKKETKKGKPVAEKN
jgi:membrane fusion protein, multidrug efflux system